MSFLKFITRSLWFFRRQHLAVFVGTVISTAVLTGALIIGDSVKFSLGQLVEKRLGNSKFALHSGDRFFRDQLAYDLSKGLSVASSSLMMLKGIAINPETESRINSVQVVGIDDRFWSMSEIMMPDLKDDEAIISANIARKLNLVMGDEFLLRVENTGVIPMNAPFVKENNTTVAFRIFVKAIAKNEELGRFSLKNNQVAPFNIFLSREYLAEKLDLAGKANTILIAGNKDNGLTKEEINQSLCDHFQLTDAGIKIRDLTNEGKFEVLSERIFIDLPIARSILNLNIRKETILTYLVNTIQFKNNETPYSFVTAASTPLIPSTLREDEIIVNEWLAEDLEVEPGDTILLSYYVIGPLRSLTEKDHAFIIKEIVPAKRKLATNTLMPMFPGLADAGSCSDWNTDIPIDLTRIRDKDELYWDNYGGLPKAFITIKKGLSLWENSFGNYTAIRFDKTDVTYDSLKNSMISNLKPQDINLIFIPVYDNAMNAVNNSVDFGGLFLSLSFFVIAAGILLTILIYTLNTESRKQETGVLSALGFGRRRIIQMRIAESVLAAVVGGLAGSATGIVYNFLIMEGLNSVWQDVVRANMLEVYISTTTLLIGAACGTFIALMSILIVTRRKLKQPVSGLIKNSSFYSFTQIGSSRLFNTIVGITGFAGAGLLLGYSLFTSEVENPGLFLSAGGLFLIGCTALIYLCFSRIDRKNHHSVTGSIHLVFKNAGRNKIRSIATILLLALGTFTIIITGANRKTYIGAENRPESGTGGFLFWAETTMPISYDLNTQTGKSKLGLTHEEILNGVDFIQIQSLDGDDASCLNLNQVQQPRIMAVNPNEFDKRKAFSFATLFNNADPDHPWLTLNRSYGNGVIPAIADQTVITWGLKKKIGDTLVYLNESGNEIKILLIGGLNSSIFQGNVLISDSIFREHFPSAGGSRTMLIDAPVEKENQVLELLETRLTDLGLELTTTSSRLAEFNSVTNTYLTVFMLLGGLGVLIGTFGLGVVLLRNMQERKQELALFMAIGFRKGEIFRLVMAENLFLLITGLVIGFGAATIGILPSLISASFTFPANFVFILIAVIFISGFLWIYFPTRKILKKRLISSLRDE